MSDRKPDSMETCAERIVSSDLSSVATTYISRAELMVYPLLLHRIADIEAPVEVEQHLSDGAEDARASRSAEGDVDLAFWAIHDQRCSRG